MLYYKSYTRAVAIFMVLALVLVSCSKAGDGAFSEGMRQYGNRHYEEARVAFEEALKEECSYSKVVIYSMLANVYLALEDDSKVIECYKAALEQKADYRTTVMLGSMYHKVGEDAAAMSCYDKAIALEPRAPEAYAQKGALALALDDLEGARVLLEKARGLNPRLSVPRANLALVYASLGERELAIGEMDMARKLECANIELFQGRLDMILEGKASSTPLP